MKRFTIILSLLLLSISLFSQRLEDKETSNLDDNTLFATQDSVREGQPYPLKGAYDWRLTTLGQLKNAVLPIWRTPYGNVASADSAVQQHGLLLSEDSVRIDEIVSIVPNGYVHDKEADGIHFGKWHPDISIPTMSCINSSIRLSDSQGSHWINAKNDNRTFDLGTDNGIHSEPRQDVYVTRESHTNGDPVFRYTYQARNANNTKSNLFNTIRFKDNELEWALRKNAAADAFFAVSVDSVSVSSIINANGGIVLPTYTATQLSTPSFRSALRDKQEFYVDSNNDGVWDFKATYSESNDTVYEFTTTPTAF